MGELQVPCGALAIFERTAIWPVALAVIVLWWRTSLSKKCNVYLISYEILSPTPKFSLSASSSQQQLISWSPSRDIQWVYLPLQQRPTHCTSQTPVRSNALIYSFYPSQDKNDRQAHLPALLRSQTYESASLILRHRKVFLQGRSFGYKSALRLEEEMTLCTKYCRLEIRRGKDEAEYWKIKMTA